MHESSFLHNFLRVEVKLTGLQLLISPSLWMIHPSWKMSAMFVCLALCRDNGDQPCRGLCQFTMLHPTWFHGLKSMLGLLKIHQALSLFATGSTPLPTKFSARYTDLGSLRVSTLLFIPVAVLHFSGRANFVLSNTSSFLKVSSVRLLLPFVHYISSLTPNVSLDNRNFPDHPVKGASLFWL